MLPDLHTDSIRNNKTGMTGTIKSRKIILSENNFRQISGILNGIAVIQTVSIDTFGGANILETEGQFILTLKHCLAMGLA